MTSSNSPGDIFGDLFRTDNLIQNLSLPSVRLILLVNLVPLLGIVLFGWSLLELLLLYWSESAAIGFYMLAKLFVFMWMAGPNYIKENVISKPSGILGKILGMSFMLGFFTIHFGGFMLGHLFFILVLLSPPDASFGSIISPIWFGALAFFLSHGVSFVGNYLIGKEYKKTDVGKLMLAPYSRIVVMQVAIILGFALTAWMIPLGIPPIGPLLIIIAAKTLADVGGHVREHKM
jgi:hypothetical protein